MSVTVFGIVIFESVEQPLNAPMPISVVAVDNVTVFSLTQFMNVHSFITFTPLGSLIDFRTLQFENAA